MAILNNYYNYLFLAEGYTGSRVTSEQLLKESHSQTIASHHHSVPQLLSGKFITPEQLKGLITFSVVRHPLDILATQIAKSNRSVSWWLLKKYRERQNGGYFYFHYGCDRIVHYEYGLNYGINKILKSFGARPIHLPCKYVTTNKVDWQKLFVEDDLIFAYATIPELFTFGYVDWNLKMDRPDFIKKYIKDHKGANE